MPGSASSLQRPSLAAADVSAVLTAGSLPPAEPSLVVTAHGRAPRSAESCVLAAASWQRGRTAASHTPITKAWLYQAQLTNSKGVVSMWSEC